MQDRFEYAIRHAVAGLIMVLIYCVIYVVIAVAKMGIWMCYKNRDSPYSYLSPYF